VLHEVFLLLVAVDQEQDLRLQGVLPAVFVELRKEGFSSTDSRTRRAPKSSASRLASVDLPAPMGPRWRCSGGGHRGFASPKRGLV
jgi:hypothetical protein